MDKIGEKNMNSKKHNIFKKEVIGKNPKIILCYTEMQCNICWEKEVENLKALSNQIGKDKIIILASYSKPRDLSVLIRINEIEFPVYNLKFQPIGINMKRT